MDVKNLVEQLKDELAKTAEEVEQKIHQKCAEILLAASGLKMLERKLFKKENED